MKEKIINKAMKIKGLITRKELSIVYDLAEKYITDDGNVLEIGGYFGRTSYMLASLVTRNVGIEPETSNLYVVDVWNCGIGEKRPEYLRHTTDEFESNMEGLLGWVVMLNENSLDLDILKQYLERDYDMVFIDGDHRYPAVMVELELLKHGTKHLVGHDMQDPNVSKCIHRFVEYHDFKLDTYDNLFDITT